MDGQPAPAPGAGPVAPGAPAPAGPAPAAPAGPEPAQKAPHREWTKSLEKGEFLDAVMTTRGGAIAALRLRSKFEMCERDRPKREPLDVLLPVEPDWLTGMVMLDWADTEKMRTLDWTEVPSAPDRVTFSFTTTTGWKITKTFVFPVEAERYDVDFSVAVEKVTGAVAKDETLSLVLLGAAGLAKEPSSHTSIDESSRTVVFVAGVNDEPAFHPAGFDAITLDAPSVANRAFRYAGIQSPYFFASVGTDAAPDAPQVRKVWAVGGDATRNRDASLEGLRAFYKDKRDRNPAEDREIWARLKTAADNFHTVWVEFQAPAAAAGTAAKAVRPFHLYAGPLSRNVFAEDRYAALASVITYPMAPDWLARLLLAIFDLFKGLTSSAGLAVILMTLTVRGGLMPLSIKNQLSMRRHSRKLANLKPKLENLKKRFANDPRKFREEQVKLFRENGIGFPMGCVMMLLQIPIFFSLFAALRIEFGLRHEAFAWIRDLSGPDRLVDFGLAKGLSLIGIPPGGGISALNLLPLLYMGLAIYQQRLMPKATDEQQAQQMKMAKWMAIIFPVLLYNYTAALALYMCCSSIIAIVESRIVRAKDAKDALTR
jgi:YidC/Oxa1 family membrane protein insertase